MSDSVRPHRLPPTRLPRPWDSPGHRVHKARSNPYSLIQSPVYKQLLQFGWDGADGETVKEQHGGYFSSSSSRTVPQRDCGGGYTSPLMLKWHKTLHLLPRWCSGLIGKDSDAGRDWGQEEKGTTEDEMAGWHHPTASSISK